MVKRRKFLIGLGALASGSAAATGTGALSQMSSGDRSVSVDVVNDGEGYVGIHPGDDGYSDDSDNVIYANNDGENHGFFAEYNENGEITLDFGKTAMYPGGSGVNPDSTYYFDGVLHIVNQSGGGEGATAPGVGALDIWIEESIPGISFYTGSMDTGSISPLNSANKATGVAASNYIEVGVKIEAAKLESESGKAGTMVVKAVDSNSNEA